jgi:hypothetical protein
MEEQKIKRKTAALLAGAMLTMAAGNASALELTITVGTATNDYDSGTSGASSETGTGVGVNSFDSGLFTITNDSATTKYGGANSFVDAAPVDLTYIGSGSKSFSFTSSDIDVAFNSVAGSPNTLATMSRHVISTQAPVTFQGHFDNANVLNSTANLINTLTIPGGSTTAGPVTNAITTSNPFSLTAEPGTMALLGIGMLGLAVYGKRRMNREA